ncbi:MAG: hypothetical protein AAF645_17465 [Myxococcota bacterium]
MRPRFELHFRGSRESLRQRLRLAIDASDMCEGKVFRASAAVWLPADARNYWSPYLNLTLDESEDGEGVRLGGRFSPHPSVWTLFMATYFALGVAGVAAGVYGLVQWSLKGDFWWLLGVPASMAAIAFVFGASLIGQGLSADQMYDLRRVVDAACEQ